MTEQPQERRVCVECVEEEDLQTFIQAAGGVGCDFCRKRKVASVPVTALTKYMTERLREFYGTADEVGLIYDKEDNQYVGSNWDTWDLLSEEIGLSLGSTEVLSALVDSIGWETWCEPDPALLAPNESLLSSWDQFSEIVKHESRFFFHGRGGDDRHPDDRSVQRLFGELSELAAEMGAVQKFPTGKRLYRARPVKGKTSFTTAEELGPPPSDEATQSNRMNPPGIPMFYAAENAELAAREVGAPISVIGDFETLRPMLLLDLVALKTAPGLFSKAARAEVYGRRFLLKFSKLISEPVPRNDRTNVDYIPTQVLTEYFKDNLVGKFRIDGIRYTSSTGVAGANVVLFASRDAVCDPGGEAGEERGWGERTTPWLRLNGVSRSSGSQATTKPATAKAATARAVPNPFKPFTTLAARRKR